MAKKPVCATLRNKLQDRPILDFHYDFSTSLYHKNHELTPQSYNECRVHTRIDLLPCFAVGFFAAALAGSVCVYRLFQKEKGR